MPAQPKKQTRAQLQSAIKSARDIMRKDAGLNGDLDRLPQLSWILFLRAFDVCVEQERAAENLDYEPAIAAPYDWASWGARAEFTGDEFLEFVNAKLLPYLRGLSSDDEGDPRNVISTIFQEIHNRMLSGVLLRDLVNVVNDISFESADDIHTMAYVYESILKEMRDSMRRLRRVLHTAPGDPFHGRAVVSEAGHVHPRPGVRDRRLPRGGV